MTLKNMTLDPARPEKTRGGVWRGVASAVGLGFGIPPAARVRVRPHYPELPVPGPRRDMGLGLGLGFGKYFQDFGELKNKTLNKCSEHFLLIFLI